jgi:hypothetical protein
MELIITISSIAATLGVIAVGLGLFDSLLDMAGKKGISPFIGSLLVIMALGAVVMFLGPLMEQITALFI